MDGCMLPFTKNKSQTVTAIFIKESSSLPPKFDSRAKCLVLSQNVITVRLETQETLKAQFLQSALCLLQVASPEFPFFKEVDLTLSWRICSTKNLSHDRM